MNDTTSTTLDVDSLSLEDLETLAAVEDDASPLSAALRRLSDERTDPRDATALHTDHTDSHSSSPW